MYKWSLQQQGSCFVWFVNCSGSMTVQVSIMCSCVNSDTAAFAPLSQNFCKPCFEWYCIIKYTHTITSCSLLHTMNFQSLSFLGINRNVRKEWRTTHRAFGGIGLFSFPVEHMIGMINIFIQHYGAETNFCIPWGTPVGNRLSLQAAQGKLWQTAFACNTMLDKKPLGKIALLLLLNLLSLSNSKSPAKIWFPNSPTVLDGGLSMSPATSTKQMQTCLETHISLRHCYCMWTIPG